MSKPGSSSPGSGAATLSEAHLRIMEHLSDAKVSLSHNLSVGDAKILDISTQGRAEDVPAFLAYGIREPGELTVGFFTETRTRNEVYFDRIRVATADTLFELKDNGVVRMVLADPAAYFSLAFTQPICHGIDFKVWTDEQPSQIFNLPWVEATQKEKESSLTGTVTLYRRRD